MGLLHLLRASFQSCRLRSQHGQLPPPKKTGAGMVKEEIKEEPAGHGVVIPDSIPTAYHAAAAAAGSTPSGAGVAQAVAATTNEAGAAGAGGPMVAKAPFYAGYRWQDPHGQCHYFRQACMFFF